MLALLARVISLCAARTAFGDSVSFTSILDACRNALDDEEQAELASASCLRGHCGFRQRVSCEQSAKRRLFAILLDDYIAGLVCLPRVCASYFVSSSLLMPVIARLLYGASEKQRVEHTWSRLKSLSYWLQPIDEGPSYRSRDGLPWPRFGSPLDLRLKCGLKGYTLKMVHPRYACKDGMNVEAPVADDLTQNMHPLIEMPAAKLQLYVAIIVGSDESARRHAIRFGWASRPKCIEGSGCWAYKFFVGARDVSGDTASALRQESLQFGDIVMLDMVDTYANFTLKTVHILAYARRHVQFKFLLRLNSNNRPQVGLMTKFLDTLDDATIADRYPNGFVWGSRHCVRMHVLLSDSCESLGSVPLQTSLLVDGDSVAYPAGSGYVVSQSALDAMMDVYHRRIARETLLPLLEDCFVGFLAAAAGVPVIDFAADGQRMLTGVNCSAGYILQDENKIDQLGVLPYGCEDSTSVNFFIGSLLWCYLSWSLQGIGKSACKH